MLFDALHCNEAIERITGMTIVFVGRAWISCSRAEVDDADGVALNAFMQSRCHGRNVALATGAIHAPSFGIGSLLIKQICFAFNESVLFSPTLLRFRLYDHGVKLNGLQYSHIHNKMQKWIHYLSGMQHRMNVLNVSEIDRFYQSVVNAQQALHELRNAASECVETPSRKS